jgi:hypothetical protein
MSPNDQGNRMESYYTKKYTNIEDKCKADWINYNIFVIDLKYWMIILNINLNYFYIALKLILKFYFITFYYFYFYFYIILFLLYFLFFSKTLNIRSNSNTLTVICIANCIMILSSKKYNPSVF